MLQCSSRRAFSLDSISFITGSKERRAAISRINSKGQFIWNNDPTLNHSELSTKRRPNKKFKRNPFNFKICTNCSGKFSKSGLRKHWNNCTGNPFPGERIVVQLANVVEGRLHSEAVGELHNVLSTAHEDEEILAIRFDWIVIVYGNNLCLNLSKSFQQQNIRTYIRNTGKLLIAARRICSNITDFASLYDSSHCDAVVGAIHSIAGFDSTLKSFKSPGTAQALVTLVNNIGETVLIQYMKLKLIAKEDTATRFLRVFMMDAKLKILKMAIATKNQNRRRKTTDNIPCLNDVYKLATYLDEKRDACYIELTKRYSYAKWFLLAKLTLMSILAYNRKRVGDTQNILLSYFNKRQIVADHRDSSLISESSKEMIKSRMIIRGKKDFDVPLLLKHSYDACISLLLRYRKDAGVPDKNEFLFALPSKIGKIRVIDPCYLFREYSKSCGAENPTSLRGTNLRKQFASMCATMKLSDNDISNVAKFMGHSETVHRNYYRHNPFHQQLEQMPGLLEAAQGKRKITSIDVDQAEGESKRKRKKQDKVSDNDNVGQVRSYNAKGGTKEKRKKEAAQDKKKIKSESKRKRKKKDHQCPH